MGGDSTTSGGMSAEVLKRRLVNDMDKPPTKPNKSPPPATPEPERVINEPEGWTALQYEMGLHRKPLERGVAVDDYLGNLKKQEARQQNLLRASMHFGSADGRNAGFIHRDSKYIRAVGRDDISRGVPEDSANGMPDSNTIRSIHGAYASKHGYHWGWENQVGISSQIEQNKGGMEEREAVQDSLTGYNEKEMLYAGAMATGMDGLQVYGHRKVDRDAIDFAVAENDKIGGGDFGAGRGGRFQAGAEGSQWVRSAVSMMDDGGAFSKMPEDQGAYMQETVHDFAYTKEAESAHAQPSVREGFRQPQPMGATAAELLEANPFGTTAF